MWILGNAFHAIFHGPSLLLIRRVAFAYSNKLFITNHNLCGYPTVLQIGLMKTEKIIHQIDPLESN